MDNTQKARNAMTNKQERHEGSNTRTQHSIYTKNERGDTENKNTYNTFKTKNGNHEQTRINI